MMRRTVLMIGGGPAGLAAALRLSALGYAVTLLERRSHLGGRLLAPHDGGAEAIPPVILGCHQATLDLLETLGTADQIGPPPWRSPEFLLPGHRPARLRRPWAPAPLSTVLGLILFRGLPLRDRWRALTWLERTWEGDPGLPADLDSRTADEWLAEAGQSASARASVWNPLCRLLLGDELTVVSAAILVSTLARCFLAGRRRSGIVIPDRGLLDLLVNPARHRLDRAGTTIRLDTTASQIRIDAQRVSGVQLKTGEMLVAEWYVAAVPHWALTPLLPERALTHFAYFQHLTKLSDSPALTVHLWIERPHQASRLLLLSGGRYDWLVVRADARTGGRRMLVSLVATGRAGLLDQADQDLLESAHGELASACPALASAGACDYQIVREPRAFLSVRPGTAGLRPLPQSPFPNLLLAGDWTDTGLPATLESAILSGDRCAQAIMRKE